MSIIRDIEAVTNADPLRAARAIYGSMVIQAIGSLCASGATREEIGELIGASLALAGQFAQAANRVQTPGQQLDGALGVKIKLD